MVTLNGFSGHADLPGLLSWCQAFKQPPQKTFIVHGEPDAAQELANGCARIWVSKISRYRQCIRRWRSDPAMAGSKQIYFGFV